MKLKQFLEYISIPFLYLFCLIFIYPASQWIGIFLLLFLFHEQYYKRTHLYLIGVCIVILFFNLINFIFWIDLPKETLNKLNYSCTFLKKHEASYYQISSFKNESPQTVQFILEQIGDCKIYQGSFFLYDNIFHNYKPLKLPYDSSSNYLANSARHSLIKLYPDLSFLNNINDNQINLLYSDKNDEKTKIQNHILNRIILQSMNILNTYWKPL